MIARRRKQFVQLGEKGAKFSELLTNLRLGRLILPLVQRDFDTADEMIREMDLKMALLSDSLIALVQENARLTQRMQELEQATVKNLVVPVTGAMPGVEATKPEQMVPHLSVEGDVLQDVLMCAAYPVFCSQKLEAWCSVEMLVRCAVKLRKRYAGKEAELTAEVERSMLDERLSVRVNNFTDMITHWNNSDAHWCILEHQGKKYMKLSRKAGQKATSLLRREQIPESFSSALANEELDIFAKGEVKEILHILAVNQPRDVRGQKRSKKLIGAL
jgi:hypothetical protein